MNIAIAGFGLEGKANYNYWSTQYPDADITIVDQHPVEAPEGTHTIIGEDAFLNLSGFDLVVRTASLPPRNIKTDGTLWSGTNEFFEQCPAPIIGVTGTKGKGTTSSMITEILRADGRTVHLVGNIGVPALEIFPSISKDDVVVFELSSFQLWDAASSPQVAVVLGIEPDHLNVHSDMEDYVAAKGRIRSNQKPGDVCIYHPRNNYAAEIAQLSSVSAPVRYAVAEDGGVYTTDDQFMVGEHVICSTDVMQVPGAHNIENACAAMTAARALGVGDEALAQGMRNFQGLPHRLELVRELDGVLYYNDSFSSAPAATVAAINAFEAPKIVIVGGTNKGADFTELADCIRSTGTIKELVLIGDIRHRLDDYLVKEGVEPALISVLDARTMPEIVAYCRKKAVEGDVVLLSPACASFDMFRDFYDRGDQFRNIVQSL